MSRSLKARLLRYKAPAYGRKEFAVSRTGETDSTAETKKLTCACKPDGYMICPKQAETKETKSAVILQ